MSLIDDVQRVNADHFHPYGSIGFGPDHIADPDDVLRDYAFGFEGFFLGLVRWPGMSYYTLLGWDDAEAGRSDNPFRHIPQSGGPVSHD